MKESPWKIRAFLAFQKGKVRIETQFTAADSVGLRDLASNPPPEATANGEGQSMAPRLSWFSQRLRMGTPGSRTIAYAICGNIKQKCAIV